MAMSLDEWSDKLRAMQMALPMEIGLVQMTENHSGYLMEMRTVMSLVCSSAVKMAMQRVALLEKN